MTGSQQVADGDGKADIITLASDGVRVSRSSATPCTMSGCDGAFSSPEVWLGRQFQGDHGTFVSDVDGNGKADLDPRGRGSPPV